MLLIRFILLGLASLNCAWALSNGLREYLRFMIQSFDPVHQAAPLDSMMLVAWLAVAAASGFAAFVLFRITYKEGRAARIVAMPESAQQPPDIAA